MEVKGIIQNYRIGARTQTANQMIITIEGYDKEKAKSLVGKKVVWKTPSGKDMIGKVTGAHGNKGAIKARFDKGLPGQSIGTEVSII